MAELIDRTKRLKEKGFRRRLVAYLFLDGGNLLSGLLVDTENE